MKTVNSNKLTKLGKRTFSADRIPVASALGRALIYGKDSSNVISAVRFVAKNGGSSKAVTIKNSLLNTSK